MKKIILVILSAILLFGCNKKETNLEDTTINVNEWMISEDINENYIKTILGTPDYVEDANENPLNQDILQWDNYEIIDGISGTLRLSIFEYNDKPYTNWHWTCQCNDDLYNNIHSAFLSNYKEFHHTEQPIKRDDKTSYCGFELWENEEESKRFGVDYSYAMYVYYFEDGVISVCWGHTNNFTPGSMQK